MFDGHDSQDECEDPIPDVAPLKGKCKTHREEERGDEEELQTDRAADLNEVR